VAGGGKERAGPQQRCRIFQEPSTANMIAWFHGTHLEFLWDGEKSFVAPFG
jgi:hypothetical protein